MNQGVPNYQPQPAGMTNYPQDQPAGMMDDVHYDGGKEGERLVDDSLINPRINFIRKVYMIISCQLIFTAFMTYLSFQFVGYQQWQYDNVWTVFPACVCQIWAMCTIFCCRDQARTTPNNYILLSIFTAGEAWIVSYITTQYDPSTVIMAATMTAALTIALTIHAFTCKTDYTYCGAFLFIAGMTLFMFVIFMLIFPGLFNNTLYCCIGVILYSFYLIYDTQLLMGGKRYELTLDDYVIAALIIYIDIIRIFLYILSLMGNKRWLDFKGNISLLRVLW